MIARLFKEDDHHRVVDEYLADIPPRQVRLSQGVYLESGQKFRDLVKRMLPFLIGAMGEVAAERGLDIEDLGPDHVDPVVDLAFSRAKRHEGFFAWTKYQLKIACAIGKDPFQLILSEAMETWAYYTIDLMRYVFRVYVPLKDCLRCTTDGEARLRNELDKSLTVHCELFGRPKSEHDRKIVAEMLAISSRTELTDPMFLTVDRKLEKALGMVLPAMVRDHPGRVAAIGCQLLRRGG